MNEPKGPMAKADAATPKGAARIDPSRVTAIMQAAIGDGGAELEGIAHNYKLNRSTVAEYRDEIVQMINLLPDEFMDNGGGGWSFLNLCTQRDGSLWTGMQLVAEQLYCLAAALDLGRFVLPRYLWDAMPGGVPYVVFDRSKFVTTPASTSRTDLEQAQASPTVCGEGR